LEPANTKTRLSLTMSVGYKKFTGASIAQCLPAPGLLNCGTSSKLVPRPYFKRVPFRVPRGVQTLVLHFPAVRAEIEFEHRLANVLAARALIATGFSLNLAARALGISASNLSIWTRGFHERGADALRPKIRRGTADTCVLQIGLSRKDRNSISAANINNTRFFLPRSADFSRAVGGGKIFKS
jgi:hypothetical protein